MIVTVTANVALDRTYVIDHLEVGAVHKVQKAFAHTGGKGVNVSRVVASLGGQTLVTGMVGAAGLDEATRELSASGLSAALFAVAGAPRQTVTVTAQDGTTTAFDELGPTITAQEWIDFEAHVAGLLDGAEMLVIAGSLPPGAPEQALENLCAKANDHNVSVILDARGAAMRAAQNQAPLVAKLNRDELEQTLEREVKSEDEVVRGALQLQAAGAQNVVVTLGAQGALGVDHDQVWRVGHAAASGNPVGAGDAFSAGLALAMVAHKPFDEALKEGAAAAIASLQTPTAGAIDPAAMRAALPGVQTQRIGTTVAR
jgi:tagatose 6-phosphate kinase